MYSHHGSSILKDYRLLSSLLIASCAYACGWLELSAWNACIEFGLFAASGGASKNSDAFTGPDYRRSLITCLVGIMIRKLAS